MLCASVVVQTPSDVAWDLKAATVYCRRAIINCYDIQGRLKPCEVKIHSTINSLFL